TFREILLEGLATDGGLALPETYPRYAPADLARLRKLNYRDLAFDVLSRYIDDIPVADLKKLIDDTYTAEVFGSEDITPLKTLEPGLHILQLSNGPTLAFKDVAMQLLGNLFEYVLAADNGELNILGATSGDTGSAAEYAMRGKRGVRVFMLSPHGKMSRFQTAQMYSLADPNIFNIAIKGVFDDCQDIVKQVSNDESFKSRYHIGTVNSINWARVAAQIVYYFKGYFAATANNTQQVSFAVPSGNFGNILAGHIARMMGLPVRRLILATNENNVLDEFFHTGRYRPRASSEVQQTSSPSMDISRASNFERFMFDVVGRDGAKLRALWQAVDRGGEFNVAETALIDTTRTFALVSGSSTHANRIATIRDIHKRFGVMIDTHTADGVKVGLEHREAGVPLICLETAQPVKFAEVMREALGLDPECPAHCRSLEQLPQRVRVMDINTEAVKHYIVDHIK
ncbi:MAG TPA: threonine synthase, partial [Burkholderiales bacterium]|nr:threonine synthase [Burkholderiales bacterium]